MTKTTRRRFAILLAAIGCIVLPAQFSAAATWPDRPVTIVVPFPAGGPSDTLARLFAERLSDILKQPFVVENRPGANGNLGASQVARAAPDGYTLLLSGNGHNAMNHGLYAPMPYDSRRDFAHIALFASTPNAIVVTADFPAKTLREFVELAKKQGEPIPFASPGVGSSGHLSMALFEKTAGLNLRHIPYRGAAPAITDLIGKHVNVGIMNVDVPLPYVKSGQLRVLAVTSDKRNPLYPDAPTVAEEGMPGFSALGWFGLSAPAGTPQDIVTKLNAAVSQALADDKIKQRLAAGGYIPGGGSPEQYADFISAEIDKWTKLAKDAGISAK
jgi:tripartite-type tricarboxylate transporter receptor subunit TctC